MFIELKTYNKFINKATILRIKQFVFFKVAQKNTRDEHFSNSSEKARGFLDRPLLAKTEKNCSEEVSAMF